MQYLVLGLGLAVGLVLLFRGLTRADPRHLARWLRFAAIALAILIAGLLIASGRGAALGGLLVALLPLFARWRMALGRARAAAGPSPGRSSTVETVTLRMELDHDSGRMDGEVRGGRFRGCRLSGLATSDLEILLAELRQQDPQGAALLESFLTRERPDWAGHPGSKAGDDGAGGPDGPMGEAEALAVLGLDAGADAAAIREAHRRLMLRNHPDQGGSTYLAAKINQARDVLLKAGGTP